MDKFLIAGLSILYHMTKEELRQFILNNFPMKNGRFTGDVERYCKRRWTDVYDAIVQSSEYEKFSDKAYCIIEGGEHRCLQCNALIPFTWEKREHKYCSRKCMAASEEWRRLYKESCIERYGVDNCLKSDEVQAKRKATCVEKYGHENPFGSDIIKDKIKSTMLEKYGVTSPIQNEEIRHKTEETCIKRYGSSNPFGSALVQAKSRETMILKYGHAHALQVEELREKARQSSLRNWGTENPMSSPEVMHRSLCGRAGVPYSDNPYSAVLKKYGISSNIEPTLIVPTKYGELPKEIIEAQVNGTVTIELLKKHYSDYRHAAYKLGIELDGNITIPHQMVCDILDKHGVEYITNTRSVIKPKELDIWIPEHNVGIEVNGLYWHCTDIPITDKRHLEKFELARSLGIKLLQITDADILNKPELIESMILSKLGKLPESIMARKCAIVGLSISEANEFYSRWHYQGKTTIAARSIALLYDNEIVALLSCTMKGKECRIERYACKPFANVVGGYSKLESRLIKLEMPERLVTFSLGLISDGSLYSRNGYETEGYATKPEWYVSDNKLLMNRQRFMKHKMPKLFGEGFSPDKTEWENIIDNGLRLYFGAGITKWVKEIL
nr:MAG TPA: endonuclease-like protein [Caudoviricetes sp.]